MTSGDAATPLAQLPICWNDRRLLAHEPFQEYFSVRAASGFDDGTDWPQIIKRAMDKRRKEFCSAFIRWCLVAFEPFNGEHPTSLPKIMDFVNVSTYWELFVEIFYALSQSNGKDEKILGLLNEKRKELGYEFFLSLPDHHRSASSRRRGELSSKPPTLGASESGQYREPVIALSTCTKAGEHENLGYSQAITRQDAFGATDEIEVASEAFMQIVPDNDFPPAVLSRYGQRTRKAAPSRECLAEFVLKDKEHELEIKAGQRKQKRKQKKHQCGKRNTHQITEILGKKTLVEKYIKIAKTDSEDALQNGYFDKSLETLENDLMPTDAQTIVVNNTSKSIDNLNDCLNVKTARRRDRVRNQTKRTSELALIPSEETPSKKKRKLPRCQRERESVPACILTKDACSTADSPAFDNKRKKKVDNAAVLKKLEISYEMGGGESGKRSETANSACSYPVNKAMVGFAGFWHAYALVPSHTVTTSRRKEILDTQTPSIYLLPPTQVSQPSSTLLDDTLVKCMAPDGKGRRRNNNGLLMLTTTYVQQDAVEDPIRLEKMAASLKRNRMHSYLPKPPIPEGRRPLIWAASRQALCETTTWFRCYHGGVYFSDGKAHGYLLGGYSSQRDVFHHDGRLIISHGGGKSLEGSAGQRDQDVSVRSLLYNYREQRPLVLLADNKYAFFPFDLGGMMYVVLGLYWIVNAWAERDVCEIDGKLHTRVKYKFAFQYCEGQGSPWWLGTSSKVPSDGSHSASGLCGDSERPAVLPRDEMSGAHSLNAYPPRSTLERETTSTSVIDKSRCAQCGKCSQRIYRQGWMCLLPDCANFFCIDSEEVFLLDYEEGFLELQSDLGFGKIDLRLASSLCMPDHSADSIYSTKGWWCANCGQLCPREKWECWECSQCKRSFPHGATLPIRSHKEFWNQELDLKDHSVYRIYDGSGITVSTRTWTESKGIERGLHYIFKLPDDRGQIHLICGNAVVNKRADTLFRQYQEDARDRPFLRRYPLRFHHARGRMLTNYFSHNAGAPYEYAVTTNVTDPFDRAPASVNGALQLIKDRASSVVCEGADFNEILTAAYMAEQKMSYHTDDEKDLGPVVASLSLGSIAFMHFRHRKNVANCNVERQLTVILRHGDVLVMQGAAIQKMYEHTVVPMNFRIAATARCIDQGQQCSIVSGLRDSCRLHN